MRLSLNHGRLDFERYITYRTLFETLKAKAEPAPVVPKSASTLKMTLEWFIERTNCLELFEGSTMSLYVVLAQSVREIYPRIRYVAGTVEEPVIVFANDGDMFEFKLRFD